MTKDEIKKALRCCKGQGCCDCPHWCEAGCRYQTLSDALDLINEQEKEIELRDRAIDLLRIENNELKAVNEQLKDLGKDAVKAFGNGFIYGRRVYKKDIKQAKINVLNELKQVIHCDVFDQLCPDCAKAGASVLEQIDDLIKEIENNVQSKED